MKLTYLTKPKLTTTVYAPSKDISSFWNDVYTIHNQTPNPHKIIIGDFNCTLDPQADTMGYKTDPHKKSRTVINNWLTNETLIDTFRYWNPDKKTYTYRTKDTKLRGRIDYCLTTPSLIPHTINIGHTAHNYQNTDHHTTVVDFDFTHTKKGVGIFRCPPNAHKDPIYQTLIKNTIKNAIFNSIEENPKIKLQMALFDARIKLEEELHSLKHKVPNWSTKNRQISIETTIGNLLSLEPTNEELLDEKLTLNKPLLLEYVLGKMQTETITYAKRTKRTQDKTGDTLRTHLSTLLTEPESHKNLAEIHKTPSKHSKMRSSITN